MTKVQDVAAALEAHAIAAGVEMNGKQARLLARAAIAAMREPTPAITKALDDWIYYCARNDEELDARSSWITGIDAALTEGELPPLCDECGKYYADPPSKLCPGCQAYKEHTA